MKTVLENLQNMQMPQEMRQRILENCKNNIKDEQEKKSMNKVNNLFRKPLAAAAAFVLCLGVTGVSALALGGYFSDVTNWSGAVVGTVYEQATEEIQLEVLPMDNELQLIVTVKNNTIAPYCELEKLGIESYQIVDNHGKIVMEGKVEAVPMERGIAVLEIPMENCPDGNYKLSVTALVGSKKADQPLSLYGVWEVEFVK